MVATKTCFLHPPCSQQPLAVLSRVGVITLWRAATQDECTQVR